MLPRTPALLSLWVPAVERTPLLKLRMLLAIVAVPDPAPILTVVAAPPRFKVVALVLNRAAVPVEVVVTLAPLTAILPAVVILPLPSIVAKLVTPPAWKALLAPVAVKEATVVAAEVAAIGSEAVGKRIPSTDLLQ